jgi:alpha-N-acetylglucosamine transferase
MRKAVFRDIKNLLHTSQETQYVSAIEPSQLMLCKVLCFHGGEYEECCLLGCDAVWLL